MKRIVSNTKKPSSLSRAGKARRTSTYNHLPLKALIASIDSGEVSGFAIWQCGEYAGSEVVKTASHRERCVTIAYNRASILDLPIVFVSEDWPSSYLPDEKRMSHKSILGMGMNWGMWLQEIKKLPPSEVRLLRVYNQVWRKPFGLDKYPKKQAKEMAIAICKADIDKSINDHNQAEGTLIGKFTCHWEFEELKETKLERVRQC